MEVTSLVPGTPSSDSSLASTAEIGVEKPEIGLLRGIGSASLPEDFLVEDPIDGRDDEGDYFENEVEGAQLSLMCSGCMGETKRGIYTRSEMEALRFLNVDAQMRMWNAVYAGLKANVAREYKNLLLLPKDQKKGKEGNILWNKFEGKNDGLGDLGEVFSLNMVESGIFISSDVTYGETLVGSEIYTSEGTSYYEDNDVEEFDDSDDEYGSIQKPAFQVEGEPDFDSGPPLDGLEYLRRVRWEAAQIPNVKVAQLNLTKIGEQTPYMPSIPDIAECPSNLLPSTHWEDAFLADFSKLRQVFSDFEKSRTTEEECPKPSACKQKPKGDPTVTAILAMDAASRASVLRSSISSLETVSSLSRADCLWLFALSATVDAPLAADTCASVRSLLRKCSSLLAAKSEVDDEASMLSILIAIAGKYFGQAENR